MPLDATVGGVNANSYNLRTEFNTYLTERLWVPAIVTAATDAQKDAALMQATLLIDAHFCFLGTPTFPGQALKFPRSGLLNQNGEALNPNTIPSAIKYATNEMARLLLVSDRTLESEAAAAGLTKLKAGPVELGFKDEISISVIPSGVSMVIPKSWQCPTPTELASEPLLEAL